MSERLEEAVRLSRVAAELEQNLSGPEALKVVEVARPAGRALHRDQMLEATDAQRDTVEFAFDRLRGERFARRLRIDARDPLHDVEIAQARFQPEVGALLQILEPGRVERELVGPEIAEADVTRIQVRQQAASRREVGRVRIGHDVQVLRRADHAVRVDREAADDACVARPRRAVPGEAAPGSEPSSRLAVVLERLGETARELGVRHRLLKVPSDAAGCVPTDAGALRRSSRSISSRVHVARLRLGGHEHDRTSRVRAAREQAVEFVHRRWGGRHGGSAQHLDVVAHPVAGVRLGAEDRSGRRARGRSERDAPGTPSTAPSASSRRRDTRDGSSAPLSSRSR